MVGSKMGHGYYNVENGDEDLAVSKIGSISSSMVSGRRCVSCMCLFLSLLNYRGS